MIAVSLNVGGGIRLIKTGKTVHVHAKHYKHNEDGRMAPGVCGNGSVPPSHSGNVVTRIETQRERERERNKCCAGTTKLFLRNLHNVENSSGRSTTSLTCGACCYHAFCLSRYLDNRALYFITFSGNNANTFRNLDSRDLLKS